VTLDYPDDLVATARRTADELLAAAWDGREPFGTAASAWLSKVGSGLRLDGSSGAR